MLGNDFVNDPVFLGLLGIHDKVSFHIPGDFLNRLACMLRQQLIGNLSHPEDLFGLDVNVSGLPGKPAQERLMNQHARIGKSEALAGGSS